MSSRFVRLLSAAAVTAVLLGGVLANGLADPPIYAQQATPTATPVGSIRVLGLSPVICLALTSTRAAQTDALSCNFMNVPSNVANLAQIHGDKDGKAEPEDFAGIDLDGNQIHQDDDGTLAGNGSLWVLAWVPDDDPVEFKASRGVFLPVSSDPISNEYVCDTEIEDEDCDGDGVAGDGIVVIRLATHVGEIVTNRGEASVQIEQGGVEAVLPFRVVGEPDSVSFLTLENVIQNGVRDLDGDGQLGSQGECPLPGDAAGFLAANGTAERAIVLGIVKDSDGTPVTGAFILWDTDDNDKAVMAAPLTPTIDLGTFGFGAPNVICGTEEPGKVFVLADLTRTQQRGGAGALLDGKAELDSGKFEFTVKGLPDKIELKAEPPTIACDGQSASTVTATVLDKDGNPVAAGTRVRFDVRVLGTASPINATTNADGVATSRVVPVAGGTAGVPVHVSAIVKGVRIDVDEDAVREQIAKERGIAPKDVPDQDVQKRVEQLESEAAKDRVTAENSILVGCSAGAPPVGVAPPPPPAPPAPAPSGGVSPATRQPGLPRSGEASLAERAVTPAWLAALSLAGIGLGSIAGLAVRRRT